MSRVQQHARLHMKTVQQIARDTLPRATHTRRSEVAQKVEIHLVDDLDGTDADETVQFGLDGVSYEIDLSEQNSKELRTRLEEFVAVARKVTGKKKGKTNARTRDIRAWALEQGLEVSTRGVVPASVVKAYEAAH